MGGLAIESPAGSAMWARRLLEQHPIRCAVRGMDLLRIGAVERCPHRVAAWIRVGTEGDAACGRSRSPTAADACERLSRAGGV